MMLSVISAAVDADMLLLSALLTTPMPNRQETIEVLQAAKAPMGAVRVQLGGRTLAATKTD